MDRKYVLLLFACLSATTHAQVYKWVDADGKVHYGDRPKTTGVEEIKIKPAPPAVSGPDVTKKNQRDIDNWLKARDVEREQDKRKQAAAKIERDKLMRKCAHVRNELRDMERGGVVWYDLDDTGKRRYYSDKEIAQEIVDLKKTIADNCPS